MFLQKSSEMFTDQVTDIKERNHHYKHAGQTERDLQKYDSIIIFIIINNNNNICVLIENCTIGVLKYGNMFSINCTQK